METQGKSKKTTKRLVNSSSMLTTYFEKQQRGWTEKIGEKAVRFWGEERRNHIGIALFTYLLSGRKIEIFLHWSDWRIIEF